MHLYGLRCLIQNSNFLVKHTLYFLCYAHSNWLAFEITGSVVLYFLFCETIHCLMNSLTVEYIYTGTWYYCFAYKASGYWWKQNQNSWTWCSIGSQGPCSFRHANWPYRYIIFVLLSFTCDYQPMYVTETFHSPTDEMYMKEFLKTQ